MSRLAVTLTQDVGDKVSVVPCGDRMLVSFGRRQGEGAVFIDMPQAQVALLLSKLTTAFMEMDAPPSWPPADLDPGVTTAGDAGLGVLASLRGKLEAKGERLTAPADDFGPIHDNSLGSPSLGVALSLLGPTASVDDVRAVMGLPPLGVAPLVYGGGSDDETNVVAFVPARKS